MGNRRNRLISHLLIQTGKKSDRGKDGGQKATRKTKKIIYGQHQVWMTVFNNTEVSTGENTCSIRRIPVE